MTNQPQPMTPERRLRDTSEIALQALREGLPVKLGDNIWRRDEETGEFGVVRRRKTIPGNISLQILEPVSLREAIASWDDEIVLEMRVLSLADLLAASAAMSEEERIQIVGMLALWPKDR